MQYKCVPAPMEIIINNKSSYDQAVRSFADIINNETINDWIFHSMETIVVKQYPGCLASLFGAKAIFEEYNMLIFSNENIKILTNENEIENNNIKNNYLKYIVVDNVNLRSEPNMKSKIIRILKKNEKLDVIREGEIINVNNVKAPWFNVLTETGEIGWCFSGNLKKI